MSAVKNVSITLDPKAHEAGLKLAKLRRRNFSNYVEWMIEEDWKMNSHSVRPLDTHEPKEGK